MAGVLSELERVHSQSGEVELVPELVGRVPSKHLEDANTWLGDEHISGRSNLWLKPRTIDHLTLVEDLRTKTMRNKEQ